MRLQVAQVLEIFKLTSLPILAWFCGSVSPVVVVKLCVGFGFWHVARPVIRYLFVKVPFILYLPTYIQERELAPLLFSQPILWSSLVVRKGVLLAVGGSFKRRRKRITLLSNYEHRRELNNTPVHSDRITTNSCYNDVTTRICHCNTHI